MAAVTEVVAPQFPRPYLSRGCSARRVLSPGSKARADVVAHKPRTRTKKRFVRFASFETLSGRIGAARLLQLPPRLSSGSDAWKRVARGSIEGESRGCRGWYVYCSELSLLARVVAASHGTIFIIRPFVFSATARPESNNSAPRTPRACFSL